MKTVLPQNRNIIQNNIICHGKYALPDASLSYCILSSLPHALNIGFYLITKTSKGTIFFIFNLGKYGFRSSLFLSQAQKNGRWAVEKQREKTTGVLAKRVVLFIPTYVASYSFWNVPCLVLAQGGMDARIRNSLNVYGTSQRWWEQSWINWSGM